MGIWSLNPRKRTFPYLFPSSSIRVKNISSLLEVIFKKLSSNFVHCYENEVQ